MHKFEKGRGQEAKRANEEEIEGISSPGAQQSGGSGVSYFHRARNVAIFGNLVLNGTTHSHRPVIRSPFSGITFIDWFGREYYLDIHFTATYEVRPCIKNQMFDVHLRNGVDIYEGDGLTLDWLIIASSIYQ